MDTLGAALRTWRDRLDPAELGLTRNGPRRAPGLRREELAVLAGISIDYVVRLEQGRAPTPSAPVCLSLARALHLSDEEQAHLMRLAGHAADPQRIPRLIPASMHRIIDQLAANPVAVYDATWQLLHWNPLYAALLGDPTAQAGEARNALLALFEGQDSSRVRFTPQERGTFEESMVADLRATSSRYPKDPDVVALIARLERLPRFREAWARHAVAEHRGASKTIVHPQVGDVEVDSDTLTTQGSNLRLLVLTPRPNSEARSKIELLGALGTQQVAPR